MTSNPSMKAAVIYEKGGPSQLKLETRPIPTPQKGWVLIRVKAFGLNRSELFTRQGASPNVHFPRILGIEAAGVVEDAPGNEFEKGQIVATAMGGMGRDFDGGYAEYTCVPAGQVQALKTSLPWEVIGAMPEMLQTAYGSLFTTLRLEKGDVLLVRGGTTSVGLAAAAIAKKHGARVVSTTRNPKRAQLLKDHGAERVFVDSGEVAKEVRKAYPEGVNKVLELVGTSSILDSLQCLGMHGICCMTGIVGNKWHLEHFNPMEGIPTGVYLGTYAGGPDDFMNTPLQELVDQIAEGSLKINIGKTFKLDEIVEAHTVLEQNTAGGKIVVLP
ncbi:hypothetical protein M8818_001970 [Zalaria obscura]|uniref:Uncharacterized protein n=1 Tax=Zalaria obscura TaxID=2024903 RepID=A0ACC3SIL4_9PEZI